jgi:excisionase family DNA binding protein
MPDKFYTPDELAAMLKVTRGAIYKWIGEGRITAHKFGRTVRIPAVEVERLLRESVADPKRQAGTRMLAIPA